jgi:hypothetical protein
MTMPGIRYGVIEFSTHNKSGDCNLHVQQRKEVWSITRDQLKPGHVAFRRFYVQTREIEVSSFRICFRSESSACGHHMGPFLFRPGVRQLICTRGTESKSESDIQPAILIIAFFFSMGSWRNSGVNNAGMAWRTALVLLIATLGLSFWFDFFFGYTMSMQSVVC